MAIHDELVEQYLLAHPLATEYQAYDATADLAFERMRDRLADMADAERLRRKDMP